MSSGHRYEMRARKQPEHEGDDPTYRETPSRKRKAKATETKKKGISGGQVHTEGDEDAQPIKKQTRQHKNAPATEVDDMIDNGPEGTSKDSAVTVSNDDLGGSAATESPESQVVNNDEKKSDKAADAEVNDTTGDFVEAIAKTVEEHGEIRAQNFPLSESNSDALDETMTKLSLTEAPFTNSTLTEKPNLPEISVKSPVNSSTAVNKTTETATRKRNFSIAEILGEEITLTGTTEMGNYETNQVFQDCPLETNNEGNSPVANQDVPLLPENNETRASSGHSPAKDLERTDPDVILLEGPSGSAVGSQSNDRPENRLEIAEASLKLANEAYRNLEKRYTRLHHSHILQENKIDEWEEWCRKWYKSCQAEKKKTTAAERRIKELEKAFVESRNADRKDSNLYNYLEVEILNLQEQKQQETHRANLAEEKLDKILMMNPQMDFVDPAL